MRFFAIVGPHLLAKIGSQRVIATDPARLQLIRHALTEGFDAVVWCDADFLVFDAARLLLQEESYALGREIWIEPTRPGQFRARVKVHNAFLLFRRGNSFLDFYLDTALRLLAATEGPIPPQFLGPKLLTAIHNVVQCPVLESAAMFSPPVIHDLLQGGGAALDLFQRQVRQVPAGANLCSSLAARGELSDATLASLIAC